MIASIRILQEDRDAQLSRPLSGKRFPLELRFAFPSDLNLILVYNYLPDFYFRGVEKSVEKLFSVTI